MYIKRDITQQILESSVRIQILLGPRQCGKSTLFAAAYESVAGEGSLPRYFQEITFDDLQMRQLANQDPALFLQQFGPPLLLDEVQYVPNLFPELKKVVDQVKRTEVFQSSAAKPGVLFRLTGSNQILMDKNIKESLTGRASYFYLNTLTVHEILTALPETLIKDIIFKGGWPELYTNDRLSPTTYLNDYIRTYVEKDIIMSAGIQKSSEFLTVLRLLGARTAQVTRHEDISKDSGVTAVTVKEWTSILERADLIYLLKPYFNNLTTRLIKSPKIYFLDTGLAVRLQGWSDPNPLINSPQNGALFETLVLAEIVKFIRNYGKDWELFFWRTKGSSDAEEIDFILKTENGAMYAFDAKLAIQGISKAENYPPYYKNHISPKTPLALVTYGGSRLKLSVDCIVLPIAELHDYLMAI
ncbi:MAG: ATP-binding protein [Pseudomonadota bacterium]